MANSNIKDTSIFGIEEEVTEGTFVAPSAATSYFQPMEDGFEMSPNRELLERNVMNSSIGAAVPKVGMRSVSGSVSVEFRASGTEGAAPNYASLVKSALGATRAISTNTTTKSSGNTGSVLQIQDADISKFNKGDIVLIKETGGHHICYITAVDSSSGTANITIAPSKASGSFSNSVVISKSKMYYTANSGHPALSLPFYWGNTWRQAGIGCKVSSMSLDNFSTGQLAAWNFAFEGLDYSEQDGAAPHTPTVDSGTPPVILTGCVYKDGTEIQLNQFSLSVENTLAFQTGTCAGRISARVSERKISGSINPYMDDAASAYYTLFNNNTTFALFLRAANPSSTSGEFAMGSGVGIYLPYCIVSEYKKGDLEGLLIDEVTFQVCEDPNGVLAEMYVGFL